MKGENPSDPESTPIYEYCQIGGGDHTRFLERCPRKLNQGFGRTEADSRAASVAQRLKWHGLQYNSLSLLHTHVANRLRVDGEI